MNELQNLLSSILSTLSVATFTTADLIAWDAALPMTLVIICGAYFTSKFVRRVERVGILRLFIIGIGAAMTAAFFVLRSNVALRVN